MNSTATAESVTPPAIPTRWQRLQPGAPVGLAASACIRVRSRYSRCSACGDDCPTGALAVEEQGPRLGNGCIGCGRCTAVCPTGALAVDGFARSLGIPPGSGAIAVECWRVRDAEVTPQALRVPCLGGLSVSQLLALVHFAGGRPIQLIERGGCAHCPAAPDGGCPVGLALAESDALLRAIGIEEERRPQLIRLPPSGRRGLLREIPAALNRRVLTRRGFLERLTRHSAALANDLLEVVPSDAEAGAADAVEAGARLREPARPIERERRLALLATLARARGNALPASLFTQVTIDAKRCNGHAVCAATCPVGALQRSDERDTTTGESTLAIDFDPRRCIACGGCEGACPSGALTLSPHAIDAATAGLPRRLVAHHHRPCFECGREFALTQNTSVGEERCPACRKSHALAAELFTGLFR